MAIIENTQKRKELAFGTAYRGLRVFIDVVFTLALIGAVVCVILAIAEGRDPVPYISYGIVAIISAVLSRGLAIVFIDIGDCLIHQLKRE